MPFEGGGEVRNDDARPCGVKASQRYGQEARGAK
jgi:hypothetical protein